MVPPSQPPAPHIISAGRDRLRVVPWRGSAHDAMITPISPDGPVATETVTRCIEQLWDHGWKTLYTAALAPREQRPFHAAGFGLADELHLLTLDLNAYRPELSWSSRRQLRSARRNDWARVMDIDNGTFTEFWRFDLQGIDDAIRATPQHRFQVTRDAPALGYHITGRAGTNGYLQRLAVAKEAQGHGLGRLLLSDSLTWLARRSVSRVYVNTQLDNTAAFGLYTGAGFTLERQRLAVLSLEREPAEH